MFLQQIGQDILKKDESNEKHENTEEIKKSQVIKKSKKKTYWRKIWTQRRRCHKSQKYSKLGAGLRRSRRLGSITIKWWALNLKFIKIKWSINQKRFLSKFCLK